MCGTSRFRAFAMFSVFFFDFVMCNCFPGFLLAFIQYEGRKFIPSLLYLNASSLSASKAEISTVLLLSKLRMTSLPSVSGSNWFLSVSANTDPRPTWKSRADPKKRDPSATYSVMILLLSLSSWAFLRRILSLVPASQTKHSDSKTAPTSTAVAKSVNTVTRVTITEAVSIFHCKKRTDYHRVSNWNEGPISHCTQNKQ